MAWTPISGIVSQFSNLANNLANDYWLKLYDSGTTNPYSMATDSGGLTRLAKCKLNVEGYPITNENDDTTVFIPHIDQTYRIVLYRNETDADANTTANAAWNVDAIQQDVAQLADSADITMKGTTLQAQDDYDRSALFVDGTDFTAGAGPHVITSGADWTPSNADMRFYKLDNSGIVTDLTPTLTDATTFTLAETLLSTDTIYIGDDVFRNQMNGDPTDIRARLSVSSTAEGDARYLVETNNLSDLVSATTARTNLDVYSEAEVDSGFQPIQSDISGYLKASTFFITDGINSASFSVSGAMGELAWESVGPTGSGATNIWTALDALPLASKFIEILADLSDSSAGTTLVSVLYSRKYGAASAFDSTTQIAEIRTSATLTSLTSLTTVKIPLDAANRFEVGYNTNSGSGTAGIILRGFGV